MNTLLISWITGGLRDGAINILLSDYNQLLSLAYKNKITDMAAPAIFPKPGFTID